MIQLIEEDYDIKLIYKFYITAAIMAILIGFTFCTQIRWRRRIKHGYNHSWIFFYHVIQITDDRGWKYLYFIHVIFKLIQWQCAFLEVLLFLIKLSSALKSRKKFQNLYFVVGGSYTSLESTISFFTKFACLYNCII